MALSSMCHLLLISTLVVVFYLQICSFYDRHVESLKYSSNSKQNIVTFAPEFTETIA